MSRLADKLGTPFEACYWLLKHISDRPIIWVPAPDPHNLLDIIRDAGLPVEPSVGDDLDQQPPVFDGLITCPAPGEEVTWMERANELQRMYALLVPISILGVREFQLGLDGLQLLLLPRMISLWGEEVAVAWCCRGLLLSGPITIVSSVTDDAALEGRPVI